MNRWAFVFASTVSLAITSINTTVGAVVTYTDQSNWETAVGGAGNFTLEDFESTPLTSPIPEGTLFDFGVFKGIYETTGGVNENSNRVADNPNGTGGAGFAINGSRQVRLVWDTSGSDTTTLLELRFDVPSMAFGATWNAVSPGTNLSLTVANTAGDVVNLATGLGAAPVSFTLPSDDGGFLGFTSDTSFSSIAFSADAIDGFDFDNAVVSVVPELSSWLVWLTLGWTYWLGSGHRSKRFQS